MNISSLVLFDSVFGNTEKIAQAVSEELAKYGDSKALRIGDASVEDLRNIRFLVVGSPTRAFSATPSTKEFIRKFPKNTLADIAVATFDTRVDLKTVNSRFLDFMVRLFGYAAEPLMKSLVAKGGISAGLPAGFIVENSEGPLRKGELERARAWISVLAVGLPKT